jgi:hypothetical protein
LRFAPFRGNVIPLAQMKLEVCRETAQTAKGWTFFLLPSSAVALLLCLQPSIKHTWTLDLSPKAKC